MLSGARPVTRERSKTMTRRTHGDRRNPVGFGCASGHGVVLDWGARVYGNLLRTSSLRPFCLSFQPPFGFAKQCWIVLDLSTIRCLRIAYLVVRGVRIHTIWCLRNCAFPDVTGFVIEVNVGFTSFTLQTPVIRDVGENPVRNAAHFDRR
jgi:hypothetical protein